MAGRLETISSVLDQAFGPGLRQAAPELIYGINRILTRWGRTSDAPAALWDQTDSLLFNTIYNVTGKTMTVSRDGKTVRIHAREIRETADRLLSLAYTGKEPDPIRKDALFDLSRAGSYAAMRELAARYPLDDDERSFILEILGENGELR